MTLSLINVQVKCNLPTPHYNTDILMNSLGLKNEFVPCTDLSLFSLTTSLLYVCMYVLLSAPPFIFFGARPDRIDKTTLPITNRNSNIFTVIPLLRFSLPLT